MAWTPIRLRFRSGLVAFDGEAEGAGGGSQPATNIFAPARLASTAANVTLSGAATIDGIAVATGDRVLLTLQDDPTEDGLWVVDTAGAWARPADFADGTVVPNGAIFVVGYAGDAWQASLWLLNTTDGSSPAVVGSDDLNNILPIYSYQAFNVSPPGSNDHSDAPTVVFSAHTGNLPALVAFGATVFPAGTPDAPLDGLTLFVDSGVLKYRLPNGDVKTVTVS